MKNKKTLNLQSFCLSLICVLSILCTCFLLVEGNPYVSYTGASQLGLSAEDNIMPDVEIVEIVIEKVRDIITVSSI